MADFRTWETAATLLARFRRRPLDGEILSPGVDAEEEAVVRRGFFATLKRAFRQIPLAEEVVAAYYCALDPAVPTRVRAILMAALGYFVLPLDGIPDVLLGIGFGDDVTVLMGAIGLVLTHITDDHRRAARAALADRPARSPA